MNDLDLIIKRLNFLQILNARLVQVDERFFTALTSRCSGRSCAFSVTVELDSLFVVCDLQLYSQVPNLKHGIVESVTESLVQDLVLIQVFKLLAHFNVLWVQNS